MAFLRGSDDLSMICASPSLQLVLGILFEWFEFLLVHLFILYPILVVVGMNHGKTTGTAWCEEGKRITVRDHQRAVEAREARDGTRGCATTTDFTKHYCARKMSTTRDGRLCSMHSIVTVDQQQQENGDYILWPGSPSIAK